MESFKANDLVTWGSGDIQALVIEPTHDTFMKVKLVKDYRSPCGHVWPKDTQVTMPTAELRPLQ